MIQVWSCGGGVQSAAIAALIVQGQLPRPDYSIIVDTEREKSTTWAYYESVLKPELAKVGVDLVRVPKSEYATVDLYSKNGDLLIPAFTASGKLPTFCSNEWKRRVIMRWCRAQGIESCQSWIGISTNETQRVRFSDVAWFQHRYPLIFDVPMSRGACEHLVTEEMGWPAAPRSSCYMCPNHDQAERDAMTAEDKVKRAAFEREMQDRDPDLFLDNPNHEMGSGCQTGFCFT